MISYKNGNGTSQRNAIKIVGAKTDWDGVAAEYALVRRAFKILHKKWELLFQELIHENERSYDRLVLRDEDGNVGEIWFDITDFFGKW
jgi:hypothetical protein